MLVLFRSQHTGQNWISALGLVMDAALHIELMEGETGRSAYWLLRRGTRLLQMQTEGVDLTSKRAELDATFGVDREDVYFRPLYETLEAHGFPMRPYGEANEHARELRENYQAELEYMIDLLDAPRGFWGHEIGHQLDARRFLTTE